DGNYWIVGSNGTIMKTEGTAGVAQQEEPLASFSLNQNYPNPVVNATAFDFTLPHASSATLRIYSVDGKEVKTLFASSSFDAGTHSITWDGTNNTGSHIASGTYIYKLTVGEQTLSKRLTVLQ
ncbi:MAG TPA: FlgD immunoglobulin-like domain containing protein, partial [Candidatus Kapabacteria bacterium]|nr:FlgD immunoglobulin-like domain containing protein [Candidatus Kapabacteria bacterium]